MPGSFPWRGTRRSSSECGRGRSGRTPMPGPRPEPTAASGSCPWRPRTRPGLRPGSRGPAGTRRISGSNLASHSGSSALTTRAWCTRSRITGIPNGRRLVLLPLFGMYTRLTGVGLERLGVLLHPVDQLHLGLRGQHDLAVHACRQTTGVALRHPPHADQRVRARAEHQLLQPADPCEGPPPSMP